MTKIADFTDRYRQSVVVDKLNNEKYCITVDGRMTQKDLTPDHVIGWFANASQTNPEKATYDELVEALCQTRRLVCQAAVKGFDKESINAIYENNGAISALVPVRPQDREEGLRYIEKHS